MTTSRTATFLDDPITEYVDLERYPITDLKSPAARALIARMHEEMASLGACPSPASPRPYVHQGQGRGA